MNDAITRIKGERFDDEVNHSTLPVVVDFYGDGCPPCEVMSPLLEEFASEYKGRIRFVKLNLDDEDEYSKGLVTRFALMSVPTILLFKRGVIADRVVGVAPKAVLRQKMESLSNSQV